MIIAISVKCAAQAETIFKVIKPAFTTRDSAKVKVDTATQNFFTNMMGLPAGYILISCDITFASKDEVFRSSYKRGYSGSYNQVKSFLDRSKPKDTISFENIVVLKDGKTMRLKDKSIVVPGYKQ